MSETMARLPCIASDNIALARGLALTAVSTTGASSAAARPKTVGCYLSNPLPCGERLPMQVCGVGVWRRPPAPAGLRRVPVRVATKNANGNRPVASYRG